MTARHSAGSALNQAVFDPAGRRATRRPMLLPAALPLLLLGAMPCAFALTPLQFAQQQTFSAAQSPYAIVGPDLNGDGRPDVVVISQVSGGVRVLLNTTPVNATTVSFAQVQSFSTGAFTSAIAVADINGDGKPDLVVVNATDNTASVLINTTLPGSTAPRFAVAQNFSVDAFPTGVAVADFDGDGHIDVVTINQSGGTASLLRNTTPAGATTATFQTRRDITIGYQPNTIAATDVNGDGRPDLVIGTIFGAKVSVLLNNSAPGAAADFAAASEFHIDESPDRLYVVDINRDGKMDVIAGNGSGSAIDVLLNTTPRGAASATFALPQLAQAGDKPLGLAFADIDGDGIDDVIVAHYTANNIGILRNKTALGAEVISAQLEGSFATGNNAVAVLATDINGDGIADIVTANQGATSVSVLLGTTARVNLDQHGLTGSWYNPATGGQGFELEVYPNAGGVGKGSLFAGWFTFPDGVSSTARRWYGLTGDVSSTAPTSSLQVFDIEGGNLNAAPPVGPSGALGNATLQFSDCNTGSLQYRFSDTDGSARTGTIALARLTPNVTCTMTGDSTAAAGTYLLSGNWFNPQTSGQGLMFDFSPSLNLMFAAWYTFVYHGQQLGGPLSQNWFTLQAASFAPGTTTLSDVPIVETFGGLFDSPTQTTSFQAGSASITLHSCNAMTLGYEFKAGENKGLTGSIELQRVGPTPAGCSTP